MIVRRSTPASKKKQSDSKQSLSKTGKLRTCSKITRPHLVIVKMKMLFFGSLDFFASFFCQEKNEEPSRLEANSKPFLHYSLLD